MNDRAQVETLLEEYQLSPAHVAYCRKSFDKLRPRYHNELHCYSTAVTFHELALEAALPADARRHGLVAALYHDARHLMAKDDRENIRSALTWIRAADFFEDSLDLKRVERLIRATENTRTRFSSKTELLLHDADVLQTVKGSVLENLLWQTRLAEELALSVTWESSLRFVLDSVHCPETLELLKRTVARLREK